MPHRSPPARPRLGAARRQTRSARSIELPVAAGSGRSSASAGASGARRAPRRSSSAEREPRGPAAGEIRDQRPARSTLPEPPGPTSTSSRVAQPGQQCSTRSKRSSAGRLDRHVPRRSRRSERPCLRVTARVHPRALGPPESVVPDRYAQRAARPALPPARRYRSAAPDVRRIGVASSRPAAARGVAPYRRRAPAASESTPRPSSVRTTPRGRSRTRSRGAAARDVLLDLARFGRSSGSPQPEPPVISWRHAVAHTEVEDRRTWTAPARRGRRRRPACGSRSPARRLITSAGSSSTRVVPPGFPPRRPRVGMTPPAGRVGELRTVEPSMGRTWSRASRRGGTHRRRPSLRSPAAQRYSSGPAVLGGLDVRLADRRSSSRSRRRRPRRRVGQRPVPGCLADRA